MITKVWYLSDEVSRDDLETLRRAGIDFTVCRDEYPIDTTEFHTYKHYNGKIDIQIITRDNKQEAWLKLCFGNRVEHFSTRYNM